MMSASIGYFFNSDKSFSQLVDEISKALGCNFDSNHEEHAYTRIFGMGLDFYVHRFENDGDKIEFEDYKYYLGYIKRPKLWDMQTPVMAFIANVLYHEVGVIDGVLVIELYTVLAKYEERFSETLEENGLFDTVSNKFVEFPQHLMDLDKLLWQ